MAAAKLHRPTLGTYEVVSKTTGRKFLMQKLSMKAQMLADSCAVGEGTQFNPLTLGYYRAIASLMEIDGQPMHAMSSKVELDSGMDYLDGDEADEIVSAMMTRSASGASDLKNS